MDLPSQLSLPMLDPEAIALSATPAKKESQMVIRTGTGSMTNWNPEPRSLGPANLK